MKPKQQSRDRCGAVGLFRTGNVVWPVVWLIFLVSGVAMAGTASDPSGAQLEGVVKDSSDALIPGAKVRLEVEGGAAEWNLVTDDFGTFRFIGLPAGTYGLRIESPGFKPFDRKPLEMSAAGVQKVVAILELAELSEHAEVVAERNPSEPNRMLEPVIQPIGQPPFMQPERPKSPLYVHGRISSDWFGIRNDAGIVHQFSNRARMVIGEPGRGWTIRTDLRDRLTVGESSRHSTSIYDARLVYNDTRKPIYLAMGQMNLFDTAGIGELLGAMGGYRPTPNLLVGAYGGLKPNLFGSSLDAGFRKFGFFARYFGPHARSFSLSYNELLYSGTSERRFLYLNGLSPVGDRAVLYGNLEYELGNGVRNSDRLSRLFLNARIDFLRNFDVITNFSTGKGLDFHRFLLERGTDSLGSSGELERFYYNLQYGGRIRYRLPNAWRIHLGERISERKDRSIRNYTTQLGLSTGRLAETGISLYANYNLNRGDTSESNSFYLSVSKTLGRHSWNTSYSTSFNGLRLNDRSGVPEIVHIATRHTLFNELFLVLSRAFAVSMQHEHTFGQGQSEDLFFVRFMLRM